MPDFIENDDKTLMIVEPSAALMHSSLITDVLKTGGKLVVNIKTGMLSIWRAKKEIDVNYLNYSTGQTVILPSEVNSAVAYIRELRTKNQKFGRIWLSTGAVLNCHGDWVTLEKAIRRFYTREIQ